MRKLALVANVARSGPGAWASNSRAARKRQKGEFRMGVPAACDVPLRSQIGLQPGQEMAHAPRTARGQTISHSPSAIPETT